MPKNGKKSDPLMTPLYSSGTPDQVQSNNMGSVEGPTKGKDVPNPLNIAGVSKK